MSLSDLTYCVLPNNLFRLKRLASSNFGYLFLVTRVPQPEGNIRQDTKTLGPGRKVHFLPLFPQEFPALSEDSTAPERARRQL